MSCPTGSGFEPSGAVEAFHGIPHSDIDLQDSPDQFQPDNQQYWEVRRRAGRQSREQWCRIMYVLCGIQNESKHASYNASVYLGNWSV